jgi:hypothetical protein
MRMCVFVVSGGEQCDWMRDEMDVTFRRVCYCWSLPANKQSMVYK